MRICPSLNNWRIIHLTHTVVFGDSRLGEPIQTKTAWLIRDGWLVTEDLIYRLGEPDKTWLRGIDAEEKIKELEE